MGDAGAVEGLATAVAELSVDAARAMASAFAVYFDLVNLAEESHRIHARTSGIKRRRGNRSKTPWSGSRPAARRASRWRRSFTR